MDLCHFKKHVAVCVCFTIITFVAILLSGCQRNPKPRLRMGAFFGSPTGMAFPDPNYLGHHHYANPVGEKLGMVYTCRGGFIDIGHVREAADRTAYLSAVTFRNLMLNRPTFSFRVIEPSRYWVSLSYPEDWDELSIEDRKAISHEVSVLLGQYFARISLVWHEILTWYGFSSTWVFSENISAFSYEDTYSDLLGTCFAVQALCDVQQTYDNAMTGLIDESLRDLGVQPAAVARRAAKQIEGEWYSGGYYFFVNMKKRNFDVGLTDGQVTPWLVPGICPDAQAQSYPVPNLEFLAQYGFKMELEIESRELEKSKIYHDLQLKDRSNRIRPAVHFPEILERIKNHTKTYSDAKGSEIK
ncbi:MAG: DUF4056 domain-containing protein [Phycisphaerae bacterium]|nr:DUF4056 domain-containing protein [Phycisphaerae bacterium]